MRYPCTVVSLSEILSDLSVASLGTPALKILKEVEVLLADCISLLNTLHIIYFKRTETIEL